MEQDQICPWCHRTVLLSEGEDDIGEFFHGVCNCGAIFTHRPPSDLEAEAIALERLDEIGLIPKLLILDTDTFFGGR